MLSFSQQDLGSRCYIRYDSHFVMCHVLRPCHGLTRIPRLFVVQMTAACDVRYSQHHTLTVVIEPLVSLVDDQQAHVQDGLPFVASCVCKAAPLSPTSQKSAAAEVLREVPLHVRLVFMTPEMFACGPVQDAIARQRSLGTVVRLVVDEVHCAISHDTFRPAFRKMALIIREYKNVRLHCFTATASTRCVTAIIKMFGMTADTVKIRMPSFRPAMRCQAELHDTAAQSFDNVISMAEKLIGEGKKIILFTTTVRMAGKLHAALHGRFTGDANKQTRARIPLVHGGVPSLTRAARLFTFNNRDGAAALVTSDVIGVGVSLRGIDVVISYMSCANVESLAQRFGRGGREGGQFVAHNIGHSGDEVRMSTLTTQIDADGRTVDEIVGMAIDNLNALWMVIGVRASPRCLSRELGEALGDTFEDGFGCSNCTNCEQGGAVVRESMGVLSMFSGIQPQILQGRGVEVPTVVAAARAALQRRAPTATWAQPPHAEYVVACAFQQAMLKFDVRAETRKWGNPRIRKSFVLFGDSATEPGAKVSFWVRKQSTAGTDSASGSPGAPAQ